MPSSDRSGKWFCNVDGSHEFLSQKCKEMSGWIDCVRLLAAYHKGKTKENPHCHWVIELSSEIQRQSFAARIKKLFGIEKNTKGWSVQIWKDDGACSYLFHEDEDCVIVNKGFSDEEIKKFKKLNEDVQKVVAINKERGASRVVDRLLENPMIRMMSQRQIFMELMAMIRKGEMYEPGDFKMKMLVDEIYIKSRSAEDFDRYCEERFERLKFSNW